MQSLTANLATNRINGLTHISVNQKNDVYTAGYVRSKDDLSIDRIITRWTMELEHVWTKTIRVPSIYSIECIATYGSDGVCIVVRTEKQDLLLAMTDYGNIKFCVSIPSSLEFRNLNNRLPKVYLNIDTSKEDGSIHVNIGTDYNLFRGDGKHILKREIERSDLDRYLKSTIVNEYGLTDFHCMSPNNAMMRFFIPHIGQATCPDDVSDEKAVIVVDNNSEGSPITTIFSPDIFNYGPLSNVLVDNNGYFYFVVNNRDRRHIEKYDMECVKKCTYVLDKMSGMSIDGIADTELGLFIIGNKHDEKYKGTIMLYRFNETDNPLPIEELKPMSIPIAASAEDLEL